MWYLHAASIRTPVSDIQEISLLLNWLGTKHSPMKHTLDPFQEVTTLLVFTELQFCKIRRKEIRRNIKRNKVHKPILEEKGLNKPLKRHVTKETINNSFFLQTEKQKKLYLYPWNLLFVCIRLCLYWSSMFTLRNWFRTSYLQDLNKFKNKHLLIITEVSRHKWKTHIFIWLLCDVVQLGCDPCTCQQHLRASAR